MHNVNISIQMLAEPIVLIFSVG